MTALLQVVSSSFSSAQPFAEREIYWGDSCPQHQRSKTPCFSGMLPPLAWPPSLPFQTQLFPPHTQGRSGDWLASGAETTPTGPLITVTTLPKLLRSHQHCRPLLPLLPPNSSKSKLLSSCVSPGPNPPVLGSPMAPHPAPQPSQLSSHPRAQREHCQLH